MSGSADPPFQIPTERGACTPAVYVVEEDLPLGVGAECEDLPGEPDPNAIHLREVLPTPAQLAGKRIPVEVAPDICARERAPLGLLRYPHSEIRCANLKNPSPGFSSRGPLAVRRESACSIPPDLDYSGVTRGPWFASTYLYGVIQLPNGTLLAVGGSAFSTNLFVLDDVSDGTATAFGSFADGSGTNEFFIPTRPVLAADSSVVYIGDTGDTADSSYNNSRIVRINSDAGEFTSYGSEGSGTGQFDNPVILGILPDNRLYIMDVTNQRLARVDSSAFDGASGWTESADEASFAFDYWYNYS